MVYCSSCGAHAADGARFCADCGARLGVATPASPPTTQPGPSAAQDLTIHQGLILAGAIVGWFFAALMLFGVAVMNWGFGFMSDDHPWSGNFVGLKVLMVAFMGLLFLVAVALPFVALHGRNLILEGRAESGGTVAVVSGAIMIFTNGLIAGVLVLVGGILAWNAARERQPGAPVPR